jgi:hypothetical protein
MRFGRKGKADLQGSDSGVEPIAGASSVRLPNAAKSHRRVTPTYYGSAQGASHDPNLMYQVQDEDGTVKTYFEIHPYGSRKERRYHRRHNPRFTKKATGGRDWQVLDRMRQSQKNEDEE